MFKTTPSVPGSLTIDTAFKQVDSDRIRHSPLLTAPKSGGHSRPASPLPEEVADSIEFTPQEHAKLRQIAQEALDGKILTRTSTLESIIHGHKDHRETQELIHAQMDRIYADPVLKQYYHAFSVAMVALLHGSVLFQEVEGRVGVSIETDTKYEAITGVAGAIGNLVPGLDGIASVIDKVCAAYNKKDFGKANKKLSGLMEPDQVRTFVPSMARPLTLFMADRLARLPASSNIFAGETFTARAQSTYAQLNHLQKRLSGTAGANKAETAIIVMAFHHASKIAFAMADGEQQTPPLRGLAEASLSERIALTLKWYCEHSNAKGNVPMHFDPQEVVWGLASDYVFKSGERHSGDAAKVSALETEVTDLKNEVSDLKQRIQALESGGPPLPTSNPPVPEGSDDLMATVLQLKKEFAEFRLRHKEFTLPKAAAILTKFLATVPDDVLHPKVVRGSDGQLRRKIGVVGNLTLTEHLTQKYGSLRRQERFYSIEQDLVDCARKWLNRWGGDLEDALLNAAR